MKAGDMVWYNSGGSKSKALVLDALTLHDLTRAGVNTHHNRIMSHGDVMIKLHWFEEEGAQIRPKPVYYEYFNHDVDRNLQPHHGDGTWFVGKFFKVVSKA